MAYCRKCGKRIPAGSNFCPNCGTPANTKDDLEISVETENDADVASTRRQVFVGLVRKCPLCGAELPSDVAICPQCGHELNTTRGSHALDDFTQQLNEIDEVIASEGGGSRTKKGWSTWGGWKKAGWVLLNVYTLCLPIFLPIIFRQLRIVFLNPKPKLTASESRKSEIIENFVVPNEKEAMVESLRFIRTKVEALNQQSKDEQMMYWMNLWKVKAGQVHSKAQKALNNNEEVENQYNGITRIVKRSNAGMRIVAIAKIVLIIVAICTVVDFFLPSDRSISRRVKGTPTLGLTLADVTEEQAEEYGLDGEGIYIVEVTGKNAQKAGLMPRDKIIKFKSFDYKRNNLNASTILSLIQYDKVGDTVVMTISRNGQQFAVELVLEKKKV
ncbi:MAG: zinc-ribbon domain-containing protein [Bacillus sp. (in: Bacteria)]|nr:zinc-ribbon domain-containing protein [Bacillus sp. (in: firmicutes)]